MFKKIFKKQKKVNPDNKNVLIAALLIHAAKIDENYSDIEKKIIKKALIDLNNISSDQAEELIKNVEKKEKQSNQIIEIVWKIVYSDGTSDNYESNLIRRICGLLYISDKDNGIIKTKLKNLLR